MSASRKGTTCSFADPAFVVYSSVASFYVPFIVTLLVYAQICVVLRRRGRRTAPPRRHGPHNAQGGAEAGEGHRHRKVVTNTDVSLRQRWFVCSLFSVPATILMLTDVIVKPCRWKMCQNESSKVHFFYIKLYFENCSSSSWGYMIITLSEIFILKTVHHWGDGNIIQQTTDYNCVSFYMHFPWIQLNIFNMFGNFGLCIRI